MGIFIRCAGHNGPNEGYSGNERQGGAMHRPYEGMPDLHRARRGRPSGGPDVGYPGNERQGGVMHRPYGGIRNGPPQDRYRAAQGRKDDLRRSIEINVQR